MQTLRHKSVPQLCNSTSNCRLQILNRLNFVVCKISKKKFNYNFLYILNLNLLVGRWGDKNLGKLLMFLILQQRNEECEERRAEPEMSSGTRNVFGAFGFLLLRAFFYLNFISPLKLPLFCLKQSKIFCFYLKKAILWKFIKIDLGFFFFCK